MSQVKAVAPSKLHATLIKNIKIEMRNTRARDGDKEMGGE